MREITLSIPDEALLAFKVNADQMGAELRLAAAVKLYMCSAAFLRALRRSLPEFRERFS